MKFKVLAEDHSDYNRIGTLHGITTFIETGDTMYILKFDDNSYASIDSYRLELIR